LENGAKRLAGTTNRSEGGFIMLVRSFIITIFTLLYGSIMPALAAAEERDDQSNLAIWVFLGFCALIIVAELGTLLRRGPEKQSKDELEHDAAEHLKS
jgi:hypothetical protein